MTDCLCQPLMTLAMVLDRLACLNVADRNPCMPAVDRHCTNLRFRHPCLLLTICARSSPAAVLILWEVSISAMLGISW